MIFLGYRFDKMKDRNIIFGANDMVSGTSVKDTSY